METEAGPGRPRGVAMETSPGPPNPADAPCQAGAALAAARWDRTKHSLLIVIGEIGTESQLRAVRAHLEQGEALSWLCLPTLAPFIPRFSATCIPPSTSWSLDLPPPSLVRIRYLRSPRPIQLNH